MSWCTSTPKRSPRSPTVEAGGPGANRIQPVRLQKGSRRLPARPRRGRRPQPPGLLRGPCGRPQRDLRRVLGPGPPVVRPPRHRSHCCHVRQRRRLPVPPLHRNPRRHQIHLHPPLPPPTKRESGTLQPHPDSRMGLRPDLHLKQRPHRRPWQNGSTPTTTTEDTPPSAAHPSAASTSCLANTASGNSRACR